MCHLNTESATHALIHTVLQSLDSKKLVGGLFCDIQKAFDCVDHEIHLSKLEFYGVTGAALKLMQTYIKKKTTASNVPIVAIDVTTSLSLTGNRDWVLCIEYEVFI